jgi:hypothetical protein
LYDGRLVVQNPKLRSRSSKNNQPLTAPHGALDSFFFLLDRRAHNLQGLRFDVQPDEDVRP